MRLKIKSFPNERQLDMMDCGPTCLKIIAKFYGKFYTLQYLREKCGVTKEGTSQVDLIHAAEEIGLRTLSIKANVNDLWKKIPLPCIVHWDSSHFVVVYEVNAKRVFVSDPAKGSLDYSIDEFSRKWINRTTALGVVLVLEPQADFKLRQANEKIERKKNIDKFIGYFMPYKKGLRNLLVVMFISTLMQGVLPFISKSIIDIGIQTKDLNFVNVIVIANLVIVCSMLLSNMVRDWILMHITSRLNIALISDYLVKLMKLPISFFENRMAGDILQRAQDHERIRSFIMNNSLNMAFSSVSFLLFGAIMIIYNPIIFYIFLTGSVIYVLWVLCFLKVRKKLDWEYFDLVSKNQSYWVETIASIQDIKINNYEKKRRWKWEDIQARLYYVNLRMQKIFNAQNTGAQFIDNLKNLLITFFCAKAVIAGEITFGVMISTQFIIGMLNAPVVQFIQFITSLQTAQISFLRLNEIHQLRDEDEDAGQNSIVLPSNKSLVINNVGFQYTPNGRIILQGIRLIIPEGKVTAIVGDSGSGKSTLLKLLLRLYNPSVGEIKIGDMNINNISLRQWRDKCGAVMQDGKIFNDTILNNIVLEDDKIDYQKLKNAIATANISQEIEQLPLGYQTMMGEQGRGLSGGQKQRLLIARALYKDPDYLFFDEATNSLDTINEQKITAALDDVFKNKTVIIVAHRLSTIQKADQIVVMQNGQVIEIGNHNSLMLRKNRYYNLVNSQMNNVIPNSPISNGQTLN